MAASAQVIVDVTAIRSPRRPRPRARIPCGTRSAPQEPPQEPPPGAVGGRCRRVPLAAGGQPSRAPCGPRAFEVGVATPRHISLGSDQNVLRERRQVVSAERAAVRRRFAVLCATNLPPAGLPIDMAPLRDPFSVGPQPCARFRSSEIVRAPAATTEGGDGSEHRCPGRPPTSRRLNGRQGDGVG